MDQVVKRRARREQLALNESDLEQMKTHYGTRIMSPVVTRRPEIDSMLGSMAFISQWFLENMRTNIMAQRIPDRDELRDFKDICETVLRQAKTEMEIEKHIDQRTSGMNTEELRTILVKELSEKDIDLETINVVLGALGMSPMI